MANSACGLRSQGQGEISDSEAGPKLAKSQTKKAKKPIRTFRWRNKEKKWKQKISLESD